MLIRLVLITALVVSPLPTDESAPANAPVNSAVEALCRPPWNDPVDAPIVDFFRPPTHPFGPGNRGLEYATVFGQPVVAVANGTVRFAGPVGGAPVVVVDHGADVWSTYTGLATGLVSQNQLLEGGQLLGQANVGFHLTARRHGSYLDPQILLVESCDVVRLVDPPSP